MGEEKRGGSRVWRFVFLSVLFLLFTVMAFCLVAEINGFFERVLGERWQAGLEAPLVEELLKPLGLYVLVALSWTKLGVDFKSSNLCYVVGYTGGLIFGLLENQSYGKFTGLRSLTPFSHALGAGLVGIGVYYLLKRGRRGVSRWVSLYLLAFALHGAWNNVGLNWFRGVLGVSELLLGLAYFARLVFRLARPKFEMESTSSSSSLGGLPTYSA
jgi:RsiW-degrading membrane proteinase PrsW (M82 family)